MDYSKAIKAYRAANNLSQAEFAKLVGTYGSTICNFESKKKIPTKEMQKKINEVIYGMKPKMVSIKTVKPVETIAPVEPVEIIYDDLNKLIKLVNMRHMDDDRDTKVFSVLTVKYNEKDHLHRFIKDHIASPESDLTRAIA